MLWVLCGSEGGPGSSGVGSEGVRSAEGRRGQRVSSENAHCSVRATARAKKSMTHHSTSTLCRFPKGSVLFVYRRVDVVDPRPFDRRHAAWESLM